MKNIISPNSGLIYINVPVYGVSIAEMPANRSSDNYLMGVGLSESTAMLTAAAISLHAILLYSMNLPGQVKLQPSVLLYLCMYIQIFNICMYVCTYVCKCMYVCM